MFVWPLTVAVEVRVVVKSECSVDVTHSSSSDGYHHSATDPPNHLTTAVEAKDVSDCQLNGSHVVEASMETVVDRIGV